MTESRDVLMGVGRAIGGALLFALPIFMTMEVWRLAVAIPNYRIGLLIGVTIAVAVVLSFYLGFRKESIGWGEATIDAGVAMLVGFTTAGALLWLLSVVEPFGSWRNAVSIVTVEALPATIGASFARSQLGQGGEDSSEREPSYIHELFFMFAGAIVFAANVAPTEEVVLVAAKMSDLTVLVLVVVELMLMHGFVYGVGFKGSAQSPDDFGAAFVRFTVVGYVIALAASAFILWALGRFDGTALLPSVMQTVVLALPAGLGAAAARLIL